MKNLSILILMVLTIVLNFRILLADEEKILAEVGPYKLYEKDINEMIKKDSQIQQLLNSKPELKEEIIKTLVNRWVHISILALASKKEGLEDNPEVKKELLELEKVVLAKKYFEKKVQNLEISEKEIKEYYEKNKEKYKEPESIHIKHILIYIPKDADKKAQEEALSKANKIRSQLLKGVKFEELAKIYSDDTGSKEKGGDLGIIKKGQTLPEFEKEIFQLKPGEISQPIRSPYGYHIVKVEEKFPEKILPFEKVKDLAKEECFQEKQEQLMDKILEDLSKEYQPKIYLNFENKGSKNGQK